MKIINPQVYPLNQSQKWELTIDIDEDKAIMPHQKKFLNLAIHRMSEKIEKKLRYTDYSRFQMFLNARKWMNSGCKFLLK